MVKMLSTIINESSPEELEKEELYRETLSAIGKDKARILDLNGGAGIICKALNERKNKTPYFFDLNIKFQKQARDNGIKTFSSMGSCLSLRYNYVILLATHNKRQIAYDIDSFITMSYNALIVGGELIVSREFLDNAKNMNIKPIGFAEVEPKRTENIKVLKRVR